MIQCFLRSFADYTLCIAPIYLVHVLFSLGFQLLQSVA